MAAQPPAQPEKPWYKSNPFIIGLVLAFVGFIFAIAQWVITKDPGPSSDGASITISPPVELAGYREPLKVSGSGWNGDSAVTIRHPFVGSGYTSSDVLVDDGKFSWQVPVVGLTYGQRFTVTVTGKQSGHEESKSFTALSRS